MELAALERLKIDVSIVFGILDSYKDMYKLQDEFLFRPDPTASVRRPSSSSVVHNTQRSSSPKPLCHSKQNFM